MDPNRRDFLSAATATTVGWSIVPRHVLGGPGYIAPSDRVNVALIGAGGQGRTNCRELFKLDDVRVVAVADPIQELDLSKFYYGGKRGREIVGDEIDQHYRKVDHNLPVNASLIFVRCSTNSLELTPSCAPPPIISTRMFRSTPCERGSMSTVKSH